MNASELNESGNAFFDAGDFGKIFQSVQNDTSGYYLVGYYSTDTARDGSWRRVHVKIDQLPAGAPMDHALFPLVWPEQSLASKCAI